jgi:hypothetical protein
LCTKAPLLWRAGFPTRLNLFRRVLPRPNLRCSPNETNQRVCSWCTSPLPNPELLCCLWSCCGRCIGCWARASWTLKRLSSLFSCTNFHPSLLSAAKLVCLVWLKSVMRFIVAVVWPSFGEPRLLGPFHSRSLPILSRTTLNSILRPWASPTWNRLAQIIRIKRSFQLLTSSRTKRVDW